MEEILLDALHRLGKVDGKVGCDCTNLPPIMPCSPGRSIAWAFLNPPPFTRAHEAHEFINPPIHRAQANHFDKAQTTLVTNLGFSIRPALTNPPIPLHLSSRPRRAGPGHHAQPPRTQVNMAAVVSCPAMSKVMRSSRSCLSRIKPGPSGERGRLF